MWKKAQVHLLEHPEVNINQLQGPILHKFMGGLAYKKVGSLVSPSAYRVCHLYFTMAADIAVGEWMLVPTVRNQVADYTAAKIEQAKYPYSQSIYTQKIIATTNPDLWGNPKGVGKIVHPFVSTYVARDGNIKEVNVMYDKVIDHTATDNTEVYFKTEIIKDYQGFVSWYLDNPAKTPKTYSREELFRAYCRFAMRPTPSQPYSLDEIKDYFDLEYPVD